MSTNVPAALRPLSVEDRKVLKSFLQRASSINAMPDVTLHFTGGPATGKTILAGLITRAYGFSFASSGFVAESSPDAPGARPGLAGLHARLVYVPEVHASTDLPDAESIVNRGMFVITVGNFPTVSSGRRIVISFEKLPVESVVIDTEIQPIIDWINESTTV